MPYQVVKFQERKFKVCNKKNLSKCYSKKFFQSKAKATAQLRAIYANTNKKNK